MKHIALGLVVLLVSAGAMARDAKHQAKAAKPVEALDYWTPKGQSPDNVFTIHGSYWLHYNHVTNFRLDELGTRDGLHWYLDHRLRIRPVLHPIKSLKFVAEFDALTGQIAGDTTMVGADVLLWPRSSNRGYKQAAFRQGYIEWLSPIGMWRIGQMTSTWGLGMLANGGGDRESRFYDSRFGDLVDRVMFATKPAAPFTDAKWAQNLYLALGFDSVYRDENANVRDGDRAYEAIAALFYKTARDFLGVYTAYRHQRYAGGDKLSVTAVDLYGRKYFDLGWSDLQVAFEGTALAGTTNHVVFLQSPNQVNVTAFGFIQRTTWHIKKARLTTKLELGFASGDNDPSDGTVRSFSFDPDYHVGMILFPEVVARMSARAADRVADPNLVQTPPKGYDMAATNGSITNAFYVAPSVRWQATRGLSMTALILIAMAPARIYSPYNTAANGGFPVSYRGSTGRYLGTELDYGLTWKLPLSQYLNVALGGDLGMLIPGNAFNTSQGKALGNVYKARARFDLIF